MTTSNDAIVNPKGGGALQGIGEKFSPDLFTGTGNFSVPIALPPGRGGFAPQLTLAYSTGNGNGPFGLGWGLSVPNVSRKFSQGIPRYDDAKDTFILSRAEDLVPVAAPTQDVTQHRPRTEGLFARILHHSDQQTNDYWEARNKDGSTSIYGTPGAKGKDPAVIADSTDPGRNRVFSWKLTSTKDAFGNVIRYVYTRDQNPTEGVHAWDQLYVSQIQYADYGDPRNPNFLVSVDFAYENRPDHFSEYRSAFEIRTVQRCTRIDTFGGVDGKTPIRTYHFDYIDQDTEHPELRPINGCSMLHRIRVEGHDGGNAEWLPPLEFGYTQFMPASQKFISLSGHLPASSLADSNLGLVDLFGAGLPDILEMNSEVRYWRNQGSGRFALPRAMEQAPAGLQLSDKGVQVLDANGDGSPDLLVTTDTLSGYYPLRFGGLWDKHSFQRLRSAPSFDLKDPEVRLVDLDGDGVTDAIRSSTRLECYFNDPEQGWAESVWIERKPLDVFPNVNFTDPRVKWADMTGDGLQDIVLVHDGLVEYWPSLGRGKWGKRVAMPLPGKRFPQGYDPKRILLGDIDGDGAADLVFVDNGHVTLWINQQGNSWSGPIVIPGTPSVSDVDSICLADVLGKGVSGLLWSKDANGITAKNFFFLDFTGGVKPYLLHQMNNHLGSTTQVEYKPSTWFYLQDQQRPETQWMTPLPFPVQVVARVETTDSFSGSRLTTEYSYHHGYWDGVEREFRGFGRVDHRDNETFNSSSGTAGEHFSPPTETRTWFHQGAIGDPFDGWVESDSLSTNGHKRYTDEYFQESWPGDRTSTQLLSRPQAMTAFLNGLPLKARRDAFRSLRGSVLRTELYALDGSPLQSRPYTVTEHVYGVREVSPPASSEVRRHRIFFPVALSERTTQWERGSDPLTAFTFTDRCDASGLPLDYDAYGQPLSQISIAVPRGRAFRLAGAAGEPYLGTQSVTSYAQRDDDQIYIADRTCSSTTYEIVNDGSASVFDLVRSVQSNAAALPVIGQTLSFYDGEAFQGLSFGQIGNYGALVRTEKLALTAAALQAAYGTDVPPYFITKAPVLWTGDYPQEFRDLLPPMAGYIFQSGLPYKGGYYAAVEQRKYDFHDDPQGAGRGLLTAKQDALGHETTIAYDSYSLLPVTTTNAVGLVTLAAYDYRVFQPALVTDPNGNQTSYAFTPLGLIHKAWVAGKPGESVGDPQDAPSAEFVYTSMAADASGRLVPVADLGQPVSVRTIRRVHHATEVDVPQPDRDETIETIQYSDGLGRVLQTRTQADKIIFDSDSPSKPTFGDAGLPADQSQAALDAVGQQAPTGVPFVVVSGWQVYDNKGHVVEKYEPFFSAGWAYAEPGEAQFGQKTKLYYDPRGHVIRTANPDGSEQRTVHGVPGTIAKPDLTNPDIFEPTPWETYNYDANDNARRTHPGMAALQHYWDTPSSILVDCLGRTVRDVERNRQRQEDSTLSPIAEYSTVSSYDITGNLLQVVDALGRAAFTYSYDLLKHALRTQSLEAGTRTAVLDALGHSVEQRDARGALILHAYDAAGRPIRLWARDSAGETVTLREKIIYGDDTANAGLTQAQAAGINALGKPYQHYDEAGLLTFSGYDFKGNLLDNVRNVIAESAVLAPFKAAPANWSITPFSVDWSSSDLSFLDTSKNYQTTIGYDALNRVKTMQYPLDVEISRKMLVPRYNRSGALESVQMDGTTYVERIAYNAKGQRILISYGNGFMTRYAYDPKAFRLARMRTENYTQTQPETYHPSAPATPLQDFAYEYDLAGNILAIHDRAPGSGVPNTVSGMNALDRGFVYDAIYRLLSANGRECDTPPPSPPWDDAPRSTDTTKARWYTESYQYDNLGNMALWKHASIDSSGNASAVTRQFTLAPGNNRLSQMAIGSTMYQYAYDAGGNLTQENTARHFEWDANSRMKVFRIQPDGAPPSIYAQYLYDSSGQRVMKVVRDQSGGYQTAIYIHDSFEHQRSVSASSTTENNSLHVMDNHKRIAIVRAGPALPGETAPAVQYQLGDHLGGSNITVDDTGAWINREEYLPYGETSFGSFARKRYRFTGKERDAESGLYYHGARYYAPWLARWTSTDPEGLGEGINLYLYGRANPLRFSDRSGAATSDEVQEYVAGMKARGLKLPSEQPGSWARVLDHPPSSLAIDPTQSKTFNQQLDAMKFWGHAAEVSEDIAFSFMGEAVAAELLPSLFSFGNEARLVKEGGAGAIRRWFFNAEKYGKTSSRYWRGTAKLLGRELHHWFLPRRWLKYLPDVFPKLRLGLTNAGLNLLELPTWLNQWLGRGALREVKELAFRVGLLKLLKEEFQAVYRATAKFLGTDNVTSQPEGKEAHAGADARPAGPLNGASTASPGGQYPSPTQASQDTRSGRASP